MWRAFPSQSPVQHSKSQCHSLQSLPSNKEATMETTPNFSSRMLCNQMIVQTPRRSETLAPSIINITLNLYNKLRNGEWFSFTFVNRWTVLQHCSLTNCISRSLHLRMYLGWRLIFCTNKEPSSLEANKTAVKKSREEVLTFHFWSWNGCVISLMIRRKKKTSIPTRKKHPRRFEVRTSFKQPREYSQ